MTTLFSIQCDTCRARLKVTDPSAVGQILACPKCGSMVEIQPPDDWSGEPEASSPGVSESNDSHRDATFAADTAAFEDIDSLLGEAEIQKTRARSTAGKQAKPTGPTAPTPPPIQSTVASETADQPVLPGQEWTSTAAKARQRMLMLYGGSAIGLLIGIGVLVLLISQLTNGDKNGLADLETNPVTDQLNNSGTDLLQSDDALTSHQEEQLVDPLDDQPGIDQQKSEQIDTSTDDAGDANQVTTELKVESKPGKAPVGQPEALVSEDGDLPDFMRKPTEKVGVADIVGVGDEAMKGLREISGFLETSSFDRALETGMPTPAMSGAYTKKAIYIDKPLEIRNVNIDRQLATEIEGILFNDLTRIQVMRLVETLTTVPVTIDAESLFVTGLRLSDVFALKQKNVSALELLQETFKHPGLTVEAGTHGVTVGGKKDELKQLQRSYKLADLLTDEFTIEELVTVIQLFIEPASWVEKGGPASMVIGADEIVVQHTSRQQNEIETLLKRFRLACQTSFGEADAAVFAPRHEAAIKLLNEKSKVEYIQKSLLGNLARDITVAHGISMIIDWESLYEDGWNLNTEVSFGGPEKTLYESLEVLLTGMQLSMIGYEDGIYVITTPIKSASQNSIEFYLIDDIVKSRADSEKLAGQVRTLLQNELNFNPETSYFVFTGADQYFLVVKSSQHTQISIDDYLGKVRSALKKKK